MKTYDIAHSNETVFEAMKKFVDIYNSELKAADSSGFEIVHGYGASGTGGKIKATLFEFLNENKSACEIHKLDNGKSLIRPLESLPEYISIIDKYIIEFCQTPKPFSKIMNMIYKKMKCFTEKDIMNRINHLCKSGKLKSVQKNNLKLYSI